MINIIPNEILEIILCESRNSVCPYVCNNWYRVCQNSDEYLFCIEVETPEFIITEYKLLSWNILHFRLDDQPGCCKLKTIFGEIDKKFRDRKEFFLPNRIFKINNFCYDPIISNTLIMDDETKIHQFLNATINPILRNHYGHINNYGTPIWIKDSNTNPEFPIQFIPDNMQQILDVITPGSVIKLIGEIGQRSIGRQHDSTLYGPYFRVNMIKITK